MANRPEKSSNANVQRGFSSFVRSIDVNLIPFKLYYFSFFFAHSSLLSYLPLYLKQLGLLAGQVGIIVGLRYFLEIFGVLWGAVADKYKKRKLFVLVAVVAFTVKLMLFLTVQPHNEKCIKVNVTKWQNLTHVGVVYDNEYGINIAKSTGNLNSPITQHLDTVKRSAMAMKNGKSKKYILNSVYELRQGDKGKIEFLKRDISEDDKEKDDFMNRNKSQPSGNSSYPYKRIVDRKELHYIFVALILMTVVGELFGGSAIYTLMDSSTCEYLGKENLSKFGKIIAFSLIANALSAFIVGAVLDTTNYNYCGELMKNYSIPFYFFVSFNCVAFIACATAKLGSGQSSEKKQKSINWSGLISVLGTLRNISVLLVAAVFGCCLGLVTSFNVWFLDSVGATSLQQGIAQALYYCGDIVTSFLTAYLIRKFGHIPLMVVPLANYSVTLLCMSFVQTPPVGVLIFALQGGMFGLAWPVLVSFFASQTLTAGVINTIQGLIQALFWGIGYGGGISIAGGLIDIYGIRVTYQIFSAGACFTLVMFTVMQLIVKFAISSENQQNYQALPGEGESIESEE